jgi:hypothetical protein
MAFTKVNVSLVDSKVVFEELAMTTNLKDLCRQILAEDSSIRFVGISNKFGRQIAGEYRKGLIPLLTECQSDLCAIESIIRMNTRIDLQSQMGKPIYSFTMYEKIKRATISLDNKDYNILMVSFDTEADHESIILNKIIPFVKNELARY